MVYLHCGCSLRYNGDDITGARRLYARAVLGPVRNLLGGRASPAAFLGFVGIVLPRVEGGGDHDQEGGKRPRCLLMAGWAKQYGRNTGGRGCAGADLASFYET